MDYIIEDGELYHAGVKGMRWGRRKARPTKGANNRKKSKKRKTVAGVKARSQKGSNIVANILSGVGAAAGIAALGGSIAANVKASDNRNAFVDIVTRLIPGGLTKNDVTNGYFNRKSPTYYKKWDIPIYDD